MNRETVTVSNKVVTQGLLPSKLSDQSLA